MREDYLEMWKSLGLDIESHESFLDDFVRSHKDVFLSRDKRPEGMRYFDSFVMDFHGLRIKELLDAKAAGRKIIGAHCVFVPEEIALAVDAVQIGLSQGTDFAKEEVEKLVPKGICPIVKSAIGLKLGKVCPYLEACDILVGENTCDAKKKAYGLISEMTSTYVMDIPKMRTKSGRSLLKSEFNLYKEAVEKLTARKIDAAALKKGISIVNEKRSALHRLATLRKKGPVVISGLDALLINQVSFYDDPVRFTKKVNSLCDELETRIRNNDFVFPSAAPRFLVSGCPMAIRNWNVPYIVEASGAALVAEESCIGERGLRPLADNSSDDVDRLMDALVDRYLHINCATFTPNQERIAQIIDMMEDTKASGVIQYGLNFCQPYLMEAMNIERVLSRKEIPSIWIEGDYCGKDTSLIKAQIKAFIEKVS